MTTVMASLTNAGAILLSALGLVVLAITSLVPGSFRSTLQMALSLWMAAGLLRLSAVRTWETLIAAATIVVVRHLVLLALRRP